MTSVYKTWNKKCKNYFAPEELLSIDGMALFDQGHMVMPWQFLETLACFRRKMDTPFLVNYAGMTRRGWRSSAENLVAPATGKPYHPMGIAVDVTASGMDSVDLALEAQLFGFHGVGLYRSFVHMDMRPRLGNKKFFWDKR